jgi:serine protease Do
LFCVSLAFWGAAPRAHALPLDHLLNGPPAQDVAFIEATSRTLLDSGQVDFAAAIELDLPVNAQRFELDALFAQPPNHGPRFAVVLDVIEARASRRVLQITREPSTVFLGFNGNPLAVPPGDAARTAAGFVEQPQPALNALGTPQAVGQPIVLSYAFDRATIQARKQMTAHVYVVDRVAKTYVHSTLDAHEEQRFEVAYRVSSLDPRRGAIESQYEREAAVHDYESQELLIKLSDVLRDAAAKPAEARPFVGLKDLRHILLAGQNRTLAKLAANRFDARPLNDPRFDSVVAVYTGSGSLGSGFFVAPDVVLTNWHVVEDAPFVEMKLYDGRQTFGSVLGKDARLDVALVRVEHRGRPVAFYTGRSLDPGAQVEAIGHPQRLEFAITRGIVSAIRRHASINLPKDAGEDVLYVQTDAPISPGNSGGPLFLDNRVVGMNTWSRIDGQSLNFALHYAELLSFLNEHLPGFHVDPAQGG